MTLKRGSKIEKVASIEIDLRSVSDLIYELSEYREKYGPTVYVDVEFDRYDDTPSYGLYVKRPENDIELHHREILYNASR